MYLYVQELFHAMLISGNFAERLLGEFSSADRRVGDCLACVKVRTKEHASSGKMPNKLVQKIFTSSALTGKPTGFIYSF
jgi:hypothetical protein